MKANKQFGFWTANPRESLDATLIALEVATTPQEAAEKVYNNAMKGINSTGLRPCEIPNRLQTAFVQTYSTCSLGSC